MAGGAVSLLEVGRAASRAAGPEARSLSKGVGCRVWGVGWTGGLGGGAGLTPSLPSESGQASPERRGESRRRKRAVDDLHAAAAWEVGDGDDPVWGLSAGAEPGAAYHPGGAYGEAGGAVQPEDAAAGARHRAAERGMLGA